MSKQDLISKQNLSNFWTDINISIFQQQKNKHKFNICLFTHLFIIGMMHIFHLIFFDD